MLQRKNYVVQKYCSLNVDNVHKKTDAYIFELKSFFVYILHNKLIWCVWEILIG